MLLAIATNPHIEDEEERRALWDNLQAILNDEEVLDQEPVLDKSAFEMMRNRMTQTGGFVVK